MNNILKQTTNRIEAEMIIGRDAKIWFFIPIYFDSESFNILKEHILTLFVNHADSRKLHFVVIDDSVGEDKKIETLKRSEDVTIISPPLTLGHQRALVFGLRVKLSEIGEQDLIVTMDGDGEDRPEDVIRLLARFKGEASSLNKIVLARRADRKTTLKFKIMYFFFQILFRALTGTVIKTGNFAAYQGSVLKRMISHPSFDRCYSSTLIALKIQKEFILCSRGSRYAGHSRMTVMDLSIHGFRMLMPFVDRIAVRLLMVIGMLLASIFIAFLIMLTSYYNFLVLLPAWCFWLTGILMLVGLLLFGNFIVLFTVFSQSQSISLQGIEDKYLSKK